MAQRARRHGLGNRHGALLILSVYLDTTNPSSLQFYYSKGFERRGKGSLDGAPLWYVYKPT